MTAELDWRTDGDELRAYLVDAVKRARFRERDIEEFELEVRPDRDQPVPTTTFVATGKAG